MKKYKYVFVLYSDNLCVGFLKISEHKTRKEAELHRALYAYKYGCTTIKKERRY